MLMLNTLPTTRLAQTAPIKFKGAESSTTSQLAEILDAINVQSFPDLRAIKPQSVSELNKKQINLLLHIVQRTNKYMDQTKHMQWLLENKADPHFVNLGGMSDPSNAFQYAIKNKQDDIFEMLLPKMDKETRRQSLKTVSEHGYTFAVQKLLPLVSSEDVDAALPGLSGRSKNELLTLMLPKAGVKARDKALFQAVKNGENEIIRYLLPNCSASGVAEAFKNLKDTDDIGQLTQNALEDRTDTLDRKTIVTAAITALAPMVKSAEAALAKLKDQIQQLKGLSNRPD